MRLVPAVAILLAALPACRGGDPGDGAAPPHAARGLFADITDAAAVRFTHFTGASGRRLLPETMGAGAAVFDYDADGDADLYLVNGATLPAAGPGDPSGALYRNEGGGRFQEVTVAAGLDRPIYGMGAAVGDVDGDGGLDLFVSGVGADRLYLNRGDGTFEDATARMGLGGSGGFGSSAAFLDYDRDGDLDLFAGRYVEWSVATDVACSPDGVTRVYCTPEVYAGESNRLYRNDGGLRFTDVTREAGVYRPEGKTLGVVPLDHDGDGWPDLAVANDTVRNFLFLNNRNGSFREAGVETGMAFSESGGVRGGMGIDAGLVDGDGFEDVVIGNFALEMAAFYRGGPGGFFRDDAAQAGVGLPTLMHLAFGTLLADFDGDGWLDLAFANGHIEPEIALIRAPQTYAQPLQLFRNDEGRSFSPVEDVAGSPLRSPWVGRGLAAGDLDGDGDLDLVLTQNGRSARVLRNDAARGPWLRVEPASARSNRPGYGTKVRVVAGGRALTRRLVSGRSYLAAREPALTIGLGPRGRVERVEIVWPSGRRQAFLEVPAEKALRVAEPER